MENKTFSQLSWPTVVYPNLKCSFNRSPGEVIDPAGADERVFDSGCDRLVGCLRPVPLGQSCLLPDPHPVLVPLRLDAIDDSAGACVMDSNVLSFTNYILVLAERIGVV